MDSFAKLSLLIRRIKENDVWDNDIKVNMISSDIQYWCKEYLRLYQNIEETSISKEHAIERREKLINQVLK
jgi:hypothetical protein